MNIDAAVVPKRNATAQNFGLPRGSGARPEPNSKSISYYLII
jgi:hypothetical protein